MKKRILASLSIATLIVLGILLNTNFSDKITQNENDILREKHLAFLDNSPFKETKQLTRKERKAKNLPPSPYFERQYELTFDPATGRPHPEKVFDLQETLRNQFSRVPGESSNNWVERGPDNQGGRTRAIMYDPNDATYKRVFAGGVSGGLWVTNDITDPSSPWALVNMPENLGISCITYDPNDTNIFYVGTGETYFGGGGNYGNGVWKSTDGGTNWARVFGGDDGIVTYQGSSIVTVNTPAGIAGDYQSILATAFGGQLGSPVTGDLVLAEDGAGDDVNDACEALTNGGALSGNIAVIRRGSCNFDDKIKKAQDAGAIAVIMVNNIAGNAVPMGGDDVTITIPSVMVSKDDGNLIIAELGSGVNATIELSDNIGGYTGTGVRFINDIKVRDVGEGNSEVFVAAGSSFFYNNGTSDRTYYSLEEAGLYKSTDEGANFTQLTLPASASGLPLNPNDLEIGADNTIWMSTTYSYYNGEGGGLIFSSTDGTTFTLKYTLPNGERTQIAVSGSNAGTVFLLSTLNAGASPLVLRKTGDGFATRVSTLLLPADVDSGIPANDFTNGQGTYDLLLELDPNNDNNIYVGGINNFRSNNGGTTPGGWEQNSEAYSSTGLNAVHPDQHVLAFNPSNSDLGVYGNDGGVHYVTSLSGSPSDNTAIIDRNNNYNTLQFYKGAIGQEVANEKLLAGAQDNNTRLINNATPGINGSTIAGGGDGTFCFIDRDNEYMIASSQNGNFTYRNYASGGFIYQIDGTSSGGQFVNPAGLDSANNVLYADGTDSAVPTYQIFRYTLGTSSAIKVSLTNDLLTRYPQSYKASTFTNTTLFVGTSDGKLLKLLNANTTPIWSDISGPEFVGSISCIELGATENDIYVSFFNYGVTSVFYTDDGGVTWQDKENDLPDFPVRAILANPLNADEVILGTEIGVWATKNFTDASPNWYQSQDGMKNVQVTSFDLRTADNMVLASTHGRGMFTGQFDATASGLSVADFAQNNLIKVYPTVSNGEITIAPMNETREGKLAIFDINGREVYNSNLEFNGGARNLELNLSSGMYIVKFSTDELQSTHKIIIE